MVLHMAFLEGIALCYDPSGGRMEPKVEPTSIQGANLY